MAIRIATESCAIKPVSHLILGCDIADTLQPMVATQETDNAGFVARLNEALDGIKDVPRARGRRVALAKMMGMSGESARKWLAGETLPTMDNARQFAAKAGVQVDWLLTGRGPKRGGYTPPPLSQPLVLQCGALPITTWDDPSDLPEGQYVIIPRRRINLSAGNGNLVFEEEEAPGLAFTTQWVRQTGIKPSNAIVVYAKGDSMEPKIHDGDILLVDLAATQVRDGEVYAVRYNQEVRVKRLFCRYDGALILRSDNAAKYPDEIVPPEHQDGHVHILGRVIWRGGDV